MIILYVSKEAMYYFWAEKKLVWDSKGAINCDSSYKSIDLLCEGPIEDVIVENLGKLEKVKVFKSLVAFRSELERLAVSQK